MSKEHLYTETEVKQLAWEAYTEHMPIQDLDHISDVILPAFEEWFEKKRK